MRELRQLLRWGLKSGLALAANLALLTVWVDGVGVSPYWAVLLNIPLITIPAYVVVDRWVFEAEASPRGVLGHARQYATMQAVNLGAKVGNYAIYAVLVAVGVDYRLAWVVGAVVTFAASFAGNLAAWRNIEETI